MKVTVLVATVPAGPEVIETVGAALISTLNLWETGGLMPSSAITVIIAVPAAKGETASVLPDTVAVAMLSLELFAE